MIYEVFFHSDGDVSMVDVSQLVPELNDADGVFQLGPADRCKDIYILSITIAFASHLTSVSINYTYVLYMIHMKYAFMIFLDPMKRIHLHRFSSLDTTPGYVILTQANGEIFGIIYVSTTVKFWYDLNEVCL